MVYRRGLWKGFRNDMVIQEAHEPLFRCRGISQWLDAYNNLSNLQTAFRYEYGKTAWNECANRKTF